MGKYVIQWYKQGAYTAERFRVFVRARWITKEQYKDTTGIDYDIQETPQEEAK